MEGKGDPENENFAEFQQNMVKAEQIIASYPGVKSEDFKLVLHMTFECSSSPSPSYLLLLYLFYCYYSI